jgi:hypothetical protein
MRWLPLALPIAVAGLETLVNTNKSHVSKQFVVRMAELSSELGYPAYGKRHWTRIYAARSQAAHGAPIELLSGSPFNSHALTPDERKRLSQISSALEVLRAIVRRAIESDDFRARFEDEASIRSSWPVAVRKTLFTVRRPGRVGI